MGWRYRAGLFLIAAVVVIWVTSAEVTQVISFSSSLFVLQFKKFVMRFKNSMFW